MTVTEFEPIIRVIEEAYEIPHLNATRKISALLPHDYYQTDKRYPVLYLQDGQEESAVAVPAVETTQRHCRASFIVASNDAGDSGSSR